MSDSSFFYLHTGHPHRATSIYTGETESYISNRDEATSIVCVPGSRNRVCEICKKVLSQPKELTRHLQDVHPDVYPRQKVYVCSALDCPLRSKCFARAHKCNDHAKNHRDSSVGVIEIRFKTEELACQATYIMDNGKRAVKLQRILSYVAENPQGVSKAAPSRIQILTTI